MNDSVRCDGRQKVKQVAMLMYQPSVVSPYPSVVRKRALHKRAARKPSQRVMWNMADCLSDILRLDKMPTAFRVKRVDCLLHEPSSRPGVYPPLLTTIPIWCPCPPLMKCKIRINPLGGELNVQ